MSDQANTEVTAQGNNTQADQTTTAGETLLTGNTNPGADNVAPSEKDSQKPSETTEGQKPVIPEKYDLKLPDGALIDAKRVEEIEAYAKAQGFSNEQAQALLERENSVLVNHIQAQEKAYQEASSKWVEELRADKEFGGEVFNQNAELAKRFINRFGSQTLKTTLDQTGLGNHPELFRMVVRAAKAMSEDQLVIPPTQPANRPKSMAERFYGKSNPQ